MYVCVERGGGRSIRGIGVLINSLIESFSQAQSTMSGDVRAKQKKGKVRQEV